MPRTDTYIEKESTINEQIDRMRHSATRALLERDDVIIVASVSCIYGIGSVEDYTAMTFDLRKGQNIDQRELLRSLSQLQYKRGDTGFVRGTFRVRGDTIELFPAHYEDAAWRITLFGNEIESIAEFDPLTGRKASDLLIHPRLRQFPLRDAAHHHEPGDQADPPGARRPPAGAQRRRPLPRSAAARAAHHVRSRDDGGHRLLRRHRELFALLLRPQARRAAADPVRISPRQRAGLRRREPRHHRPARRHVSRRPPPQGDPRRIRLPPALLHGQPPAPLRGVERHAPAIGLCLGHPRQMGNGAGRRRLRRTGHPPHRPHRSAGRNPPRQGPGR